MRAPTARARLAALPALLLTACLALPAPPSPPGDAPALPLQVGEERIVELHALRLDVKGFEQVVTKQDVLALPRAVREDLWLYDLDLQGGDGTPHLLDNALASIRALDTTDGKLGPAERNMVRLLNMTAATADLSGTALQELLSLGPQVGIPSQEVLAEAMGVDADAPFLDTEVVARSLVKNVISTHPNARWRRGAVDAAHPDGRWPVAEGHLPVTLEDVASDLTSLTARYGPYADKGQFHPGFMVGVTQAPLLQPDFRMVIRANANALPFKGVDLDTASVGNVGSIGKEAAPLFDFGDPDWLRIEGITPKPAVTRMTFQLVEHPEFLAPGTSPLPLPQGNGAVWRAPPWSIERLVSDAGLMAFAKRQYQRQFMVGDDPTPLFQIDIQDGWMKMTSKADVGAPPPPLYLWDLIAQVVQVRLHDGPDPDAPEIGALAEGEADVRLSLEDVQVGVTAAQITEAIRGNVQRDPSGLVKAAAHIIDQRAGAPDLFFVHPAAGSGPHAGTDWLYFVAADDLASDSGRDIAAYQHPGFYGDEALTLKLSNKLEVDGDTTHHKVRVSPGETWYCEDDGGRVFRLRILPKPSPARLRLAVGRVR